MSAPTAVPSALSLDYYFLSGAQITDFDSAGAQSNRIIVPTRSELAAVVFWTNAVIAPAGGETFDIFRDGVTTAATFDINTSALAADTGERLDVVPGLIFEEGQSIQINSHGDTTTVDPDGTCTFIFKSLDQKYPRGTVFVPGLAITDIGNGLSSDSICIPVRGYLHAIYGYAHDEVTASAETLTIQVNGTTSTQTAILPLGLGGQEGEQLVLTNFVHYLAGNACVLASAGDSTGAAAEFTAVIIPDTTDYNEREFAINGRIAAMAAGDDTGRGREAALAHNCELAGLYLHPLANITVETDFTIEVDGVAIATTNVLETSAGADDTIRFGPSARHFFKQGSSITLNSENTAQAGGIINYSIILRR